MLDSDEREFLSCVTAMFYKILAYDKRLKMKKRKRKKNAV